MKKLSNSHNTQLQKEFLNESVDLTEKKYSNGTRMWLARNCSFATAAMNAKESESKDAISNRKARETGILYTMYPYYFLKKFFENYGVDAYNNSTKMSLNIFEFFKKKGFFISVLLLSVYLYAPSAIILEALAVLILFLIVQSGLLGLYASEKEAKELVKYYDKNNLDDDIGNALEDENFRDHLNARMAVTMSALSKDKTDAFFSMLFEYLPVMLILVLHHEAMIIAGIYTGMYAFCSIYTSWLQPTIKRLYNIFFNVTHYIVNNVDVDEIEVKMIDLDKLVEADAKEVGYEQHV